MLLSLQGNIAERCLSDRPYGLTHSDKETGFFTKILLVTDRLGKKPGFWATNRPYQKTTRPILDSIGLKILVQCDRLLRGIC